MVDIVHQGVNLLVTVAPALPELTLHFANSYDFVTGQPVDVLSLALLAHEFLVESPATSEANVEDRLSVSGTHLG